MSLHSFAAGATQAAYGNKYFMITVPVRMMKDIMIRGIPRESIWVHEAKGRTKCLECMSKAREFLENPDNVELDSKIGHYNSDLNAVNHLLRAHQGIEKIQKMIVDLQNASPQEMEGRVNQNLLYLEDDFPLGKKFLASSWRSPKFPIELKRNKMVTILSQAKNEKQLEWSSLVAQNLEAAQKWLDKWFVAEDFINTSPSPLNDQDSTNWEITTPCGEIIAFKKPQFWDRNDGLNAGPNFSIVTVDIQALISASRWKS